MAKAQRSLYFDVDPINTCVGMNGATSATGMALKLVVGGEMLTIPLDLLSALSCANCAKDTVPKRGSPTSCVTDVESVRSSNLKSANDAVGSISLSSTISLLPSFRLKVSRFNSSDPLGIELGAKHDVKFDVKLGDKGISCSDLIWPKLQFSPYLQLPVAKNLQTATPSILLLSD
jgi:hypothetical protein